MNNIISLIPSYTPTNPYVELVYNELGKVGEVILFTTEIPTFECQYLLFDKSINENLVFEPRKWILDNIDKNWDWVIYNEDDILIPQSSVKNAIEYYKDIIDRGMVPGFIRYELQNNKKHWIDMHPAHSIHRGGSGMVKQKFEDIQMFEPWNIHSGNWIFNKREILQMIQNNSFETYPNEFGVSYYLPLEDASSLPYFRYVKVFPFDIEKIECHHLPNKYVNFTLQPDKIDYA